MTKKQQPPSAKLESYLAGVKFTLEKSRELLSIWRFDPQAQHFHPEFFAPALRALCEPCELESHFAAELLARKEPVEAETAAEAPERRQVSSGDLRLDTLEAMQKSHYYLVGFEKVAMPFEWLLPPRSGNSPGSDLERRIVRNVAHELLTPVNSLQGLGEQFGDLPLDASNRQLLHLHADACAAIKRHLVDIVDYFSLSRSGVESYDKENFDLLEILFSVSSKANRSILERHRKLKFTLHCPPGLISLTVRGYPKLLERALLHLIDNALKFTADGGQVNLDFKQDAQQRLSFTVTDTGCGLNARNFQLVFRPFVLRDMGDTRSLGGLGLGLSSAQECVRIMNTEASAGIQLDSAPGRGSSFSFTVPGELSDGASDQVARALALPRPMETYRLLVAEDNPTQQLIVERMIRHLGFKPTLVGNGLEALGEYIRADRHYDLILMDIQMPGISGHEATRMIRKYEHKCKTVRIPIVAITANIESDVHSESLRSGMNGHFGKPVTRQLLDELIRKALLGIPL